MMEALRSGLVREGKIRFAINLGNASLAMQDEATGDLSGVSVALARDLAARLGAEPTFVTYPGAGKVVADAESDKWDVAFLAVDDQRRSVIAYSSAYVLIEAKVVVRANSPLRHVDELDRPGRRLLVARGSAYDLYLSKGVQSLTLLREETPGASFAAFKADAEAADAVAGVAQSLAKAFGKDPEFRLLDGRVAAIDQAMALPVNRAELSDNLSAFVEARKADGFVRRALDESGMTDLVVAPVA